MGISQNDYGGYLACTPISIIYAYLSLYCPTTPQTLRNALDAGSEIWKRWGGYGRGMMTSMDVMGECPIISSNCTFKEYAGSASGSAFASASGSGLGRACSPDPSPDGVIDPDTGSVDLFELWKEGSHDQSSGSITLVQTTGHGQGGVGFTYGLNFDGHIVYVFDPHGPSASITECTDFDVFAGLMYKGGEANILYSAILFQIKK